MKSHDKPCPKCGHCPTCGRGGHWTYPYPYYGYPYWQIPSPSAPFYPTVTYTTSTGNTAIAPKGNTWIQS